MTIAQIYSLLKEIRDKYTDVFQMSESFNIESEPDSYLQFVSRRGVLLDKIAVCHQLLCADGEEWMELCESDSTLRALGKEIETFIIAITALDETIKAKITRKMNAIKAEICTMNKTNRALRAYAAC